MTFVDELDLGSSLRRLRQARGWKLGEASRRSGFSPATLSTWESGSRRPRAEALARLLDLLEAEPREKARLLQLVDPLSTKVVLASSPLGLPVSVGMVLPVMRRCRNLSQSDFARRIGVSQAAVSQWESGDTVPSSEGIHAAGFALIATVEETLALVSAEGSGDGNLSYDMEVALAQIWDLTIPRFIQETLFLGWEAELWRRAGRDRRWDPLLIAVVAVRLNWLALEERFSEIAASAHRAILLATTTEGRIEAVPAIAALADADRHLGRGHAPGDGTGQDVGGETSHFTVQVVEPPRYEDLRRLPRGGRSPESRGVPGRAARTYVPVPHFRDDQTCERSVGDRSRDGVPALLVLEKRPGTLRIAPTREPRTASGPVKRRKVRAYRPRADRSRCGRPPLGSDHPG